MLRLLHLLMIMSLLVMLVWCNDDLNINDDYNDDSNDDYNDVYKDEYNFNDTEQEPISTNGDLEYVHRYCNVYYRRECYTLHKSRKSFCNAEIDCRRHGGHLATIYNVHVDRKLERYTRARGVPYVWIGLLKPCQLCNTDIEWNWIDGRSVYRNWLYGYPDKASSSSCCAYMNRYHNYEWIPLICSYALPYWCVR